ncbi:MAG: PQQ-binding-like beta-propeller repeat protein [Kiritimatiellaceae bacterium]|nr:PQQ-binding-like beta-propeller repeat protein [Kiritimatiellaceae bacterium]
MKKVKIRFILNLFVWLLCLATSPAAPADLAQTLLTMAGGSTNGLCEVPRCGAGSFLSSLAANSGFTIHAMDSSTGNVAAARTAVGNLLGKTIYVEQGSPTAIPLASESADLLVLTDLTSSDMTGSLTNEILRVICPGVGRAILGGSSGSLTVSNLTAWVQSFGVGGTVQTNAYGIWGIVRRGALPGADDWTHPYHGPDMNPASQDTAFTMPSALSWLSKPFQANTRATGSRVSADGRIFYATSGPNTGRNGDTNEWSLQAFNLYNGQLLWERSLNTNTWSHRNITVVQGGKLYVLQDTNILVLDAATGADLPSITFTNTPAQMKWLGIVSNTLVTMSGPMDVSPQKAWSFEPQRDALQLGYGTLLLAYDLATGQEKWRRDEGAPIDHRTLGILGGRIYYDVFGQRVMCRDLSTGNVVWQNSDTNVLALTVAKNGADWWAPPGAAYLEDRPSLLCSSNALYFGRPEGSNFVALSPVDGHVLWSVARVGGRAFNFVLCATNVLYLDGLTGAGGGGFRDPLTGVAGANPTANGCGVNISTPNYFVPQAGGVTYNIKKMQKINTGIDTVYPMKNECSMGTLVAGGRLVGLAKACECPVIRGGAGLGSGRMYNSPTGQLQVARTNSVISFPTDKRDWTTHRASARHDGASSASVSLTLTNLWQTAPRYPSQVFTDAQFPKTTQHSLTIPLTAAGRIFIAGSDGLVQCLDSATGAELWRFQTDGAVLATPTLADGKLFVGSADGWVYTLEAYSGKLLWRYRVGPEDRKIMVYGYLQSSWPVNSGVYYESNTVYVSAALPMQPGAYVCALNATSGALLWRNQEMGPGYNATTGIYTNNEYVPSGYMTRTGDRLWAKRYLDAAAGIAFNLTNGVKYSNSDVDMTGATGHGGRGREIGVLSNRFLIVGGPEVYFDNAERGGKNKLTYWFTELTNGVPRKPVVEVFDFTLTMPAWNDERILVAGFSTNANRLECWSAGAAMDYFHSLIDANSTKQTISRDANNPMLIWSKAVTNVFSTALSSNLAIVAVMTNNSTWTSIGGWLQGYNITNGTQVWNIKLPNIPQRNGITVDRDGRVLVALHDGSLIAYGSANQIGQDSDSDGIPNGWMEQYFGHTTGQTGDLSRPGDDADGDGQTNWQEYQMGTSPTSSASILRQDITPAPVQNGFCFRFQSVLGKWYRVEWSDNLGSPNHWQPLTEYVAGTGGEVSVTDPSSGQQNRFYRVVVLF